MRKDNRRAVRKKFPWGEASVLLLFVLMTARILGDSYFQERYQDKIMGQAEAAEQEAAEVNAADNISGGFLSEAVEVMDGSAAQTGAAKEPASENAEGGGKNQTGQGGNAGSEKLDATANTGEDTAILPEIKDIAVKKIALTFDDGPHPLYTPELLEGLKERNVVATFFVTGENASLYPELIEEMEEDGHLIGNHTYHHVQLTSVGEDIFRMELEETNRVVEDITGKEVLFARPPFGDWSKELEQEMEMIPVLWDIDPLDWCTYNVETIVRKVLSKAEENAIILMHDEYATSIEAALEIVDKLLEEGYTFVTVDEIVMGY